MTPGRSCDLLHEFNDETMRDEHVQGWRFQLALFANVVADEMFADAAGLVDAWFDAWALEDHQVSAHASASQRFMPGIRMRRRGDVRHCQGTIGPTGWQR
jgi:hypothetical protein